MQSKAVNHYTNDASCCGNDSDNLMCDLFSLFQIAYITYTKMLRPEEHENGAAPMSRFTIKNEPDEVEQVKVKQEQGNKYQQSCI